MVSKDKRVYILISNFTLCQSVFYVQHIIFVQGSIYLIKMLNKRATICLILCQYFDFLSMIS